MIDNIHVAVRIRPMNDREKSDNHQHALQSSLDSISIMPSVNNSEFRMNFTFDRIFAEETTNVSVYDSLAADIIQSTLNGVNGTIFAYGQTSSGKTYTMHGTRNDPGIIGLSISDIFNYVNQHPEQEFLLRVSYLEIYNENIKDLLDPSNDNLKIHENIHREIFIGDLSEHVVTSVDEVHQILQRGESNRHVGVTNMNDRSSRSHTIFKMVIESKERISETESEQIVQTNIQDNHQSRRNSNRQSLSGGAVRVSCLNLVDLAGSERVGHTGAEGVRLREGGHINKSLLALASVIQKLSEGGDKHIPYRDSKLTRILQPSLGGNAKTAIICTVTPSSGFVDETISTLKFASRAKTITNKPIVNEVISDEALLKRYEKEIQSLKSQLNEIKSKEKQKEDDNSDNAEVILKDVLKRRLEEDEHEKIKLRNDIERLKKMILNSSVLTQTNHHQEITLHQRKKQKYNRRQTWYPTMILETINDNGVGEEVNGNTEDPSHNFPLIPSFEQLHKFNSIGIQVEEDSTWISSYNENSEITMKSLLSAYAKTVEEKSFLSLENAVLIESLKPVPMSDICVETELNMDKLILEFNSREKTILDLKMKLQDMENKYSTEKDQAIRELDLKNTQLYQKDIEIQFFQSENHGLIQKCQNIECDLNIVNDTLKQQHFKFNEEKESLQEQISSLKELVNSLETNLQEEKHRKDMIKDENEMLVKNTQELGTSSEKLRELNEQMRSQLELKEIKLDTLQKENANFVDNMKNILQSSSQYAIEIKKLQDVLQTVDFEKSWLMSCNVTLQQDNAVLKQDILKFNNKVLDLENKSNGHEDSYLEKITELEQTLKESIQDMNLKSAEALNEKQKLNEIIQKQNIEYQLLQSQVLNLESEVSAKENMCQELACLKKDMISKYDEIINEYNTVQEQKERLEEKYDSLQFNTQKELEFLILFCKQCDHEIDMEKPLSSQIRSSLTSISESLKKYQAQSVDLNSQVVKLNEELCSINQKSTELTHQVYTQIQDQLIAQLDNCKSKLNRKFEDRLNEASRKITWITDVIDKVALQRNDSEKKLNQELESLSSELKHVQKALECTQNDKLHLEKELQESMNKEDILVENIQTLEQQLRAKSENLSLLKHDNESLEGQMNELKISFERKIIQLQAEIEKSQAAQQTSASIITALEKNKKELSMDVQSMKTAIDQWKTQATDRSIKITELESILEQQQKELKHRSEQISSLSDYNQRLQLLRESYGKVKTFLCDKTGIQFENENDIVEAISIYFHNIGDDLTTTKKSLETVQRAYEELKNHVEEQKSQLQGRNDDTKHLKDQLISYKKSIETMAQEGRLLYEKYQKLKVHTKAVEEHSCKLEDAKRSFEDKCRVLTSMTDQLMSKKSKLESQNSVLSENLENLENRISMINQEKSDLLTRIEGLESVNSKLLSKTNSANEVEELYVHLEQQYKKLSSDMNRIQQEYINSTDELEKAHTCQKQLEDSRKELENQQLELFEKIGVFAEILAELLKRSFDIRFQVPKLEDLDIEEKVQRGFELISNLTSSVKSLLIKVENASSGLEKKNNLSSLRMVMASGSVINSHSEQLERLQRELDRVQSEKENLRQQIQQEKYNKATHPKDQITSSSALRTIHDLGVSNISADGKKKSLSIQQLEKKTTQKVPIKSRLRQENDDPNECKQQ